jgi:hypothetical protein
MINIQEASLKLLLQKQRYLHVPLNEHCKLMNTISNKSEKKEIQQDLLALQH